ncbi:MAG: hypothetical protein H7647_11915, partial [Candidatus Heimdallarchaeota archaeon]|nr:hypothetical protein [Candidatus Heimdallarchaeota archaeon]MCK4255130.1 hypothetical protein [Candidatus Heimdallarchaeota archaeon]
NYPTARRLYGDEPLETSNTHVPDHLNGEQFAWKVSDSVLPIRTKNHTNYSEMFNSPKINLQFIKNLTLLEILLFSVIGLSYSLLLIFQIGLSGLLISSSLTFSWIHITILIVSLIPSSLLLFLLNQKITKTLTRQNNSNLELPKRQLISFFFVQITHLLSVGLIAAGLLATLLPLRTSINSIVVVYIFIIITALLVSIISPPFKIAKLFTSVRESGNIQNYQDSFQFPKICLKRFVLISVFSFLIPAVLLVLGLHYFINILASMFILNYGISTTGWDISLGILLWLLLTVSILFSSIEDVKTTTFYEGLLQKFVNPPSLKWINQGYNLNASGKPAEIMNFSTNSSLSLDSKNELCSTCSEPLVGGAEFCTHCGKKIME